MERAGYSTDLTDRYFEIIQKYLPSPSKTGRPGFYALREILNAVFYSVHTGCQWRELPHDFPKRAGVYYYFRKWKQDETRFLVKQAIHTDQRQDQGKNTEPSAVMIDSQSVKTAQIAETRGFDGNLSDGKQSVSIFQTLFLQFASIKTVRADAAYRCDPADCLWCAFQCRSEITSALKAEVFQSVPKRWIITRTFSRFRWDRRLMIDYERQAQSAETMVYIASIKKMLNRYK